MRRYILPAVLALVFLTGISEDVNAAPTVARDPAAALSSPIVDVQQRRSYNSRGRYTGRSSRQGNTTRSYNSRGRYTGRSTRSR